MGTSGRQDHLPHPPSPTLRPARRPQGRLRCFAAGPGLHRAAGPRRLHRAVGPGLHWAAGPHLPPRRCRHRPHRCRHRPHCYRHRPHRFRHRPHRCRHRPHRCRQRPHRCRHRPHRCRRAAACCGRRSLPAAAGGCASATALSSEPCSSWARTLSSPRMPSTSVPPAWGRGWGGRGRGERERERDSNSSVISPGLLPPPLRSPPRHP